MCYSSEVVAYSVMDLELGELDKNVTAFLRVILGYLTVAFTLCLFVWSIKERLENQCWLKIIFV